MSRFTYRAVDTAGVIQTGAIDASSTEDVANSLEQKGWTALRITASAGWDIRRLSLRRKRKLGAADLLAITQQTAALLRAGLTIDRALSITLNLTSRAHVQQPLRRILEEVRHGATFADALAKEGGVPELYVSMVRSGEASGALPEVMVRLEEFLGQSQQIKARIRSALIYPAILLVMMTFTFLIVVFVVLPRFERLFAEAGTQLPLPTRIVMALGHVVSDYGLLFILGAGAVGVLLAKAVRRPAVRIAIHRRLIMARWTLGLPASIETSRFLRTLATLLANGLALPVATRIARGTLSNEALRASVEDLLRRLREGESLADRLAQAGIFPQIAVQLARVGEETGQLETMLIEAAEILQRDAQRTLERLLVLLVPVITIAMGLLVAGLVASVLVGVLSLNDLAL